MKKNEYLLKKENFLISADLKTETIHYTNVPCKVYLPERTHEKPKIIIKPFPNDAATLTRLSKVSFDAKVIGYSGEIETIIRSPELYMTHGEINHWGKELSESTIYCEPENLETIRLIRSEEKVATSVVFWISPNTFITPSAIFVRSFNGEIKKDHELVVKHRVGGFECKFAQHFKYKTEENGDLIQWCYLVAECETALNAVNTSEIKKIHLQDMDDFLMLVSFASRHRTVCMGWEAFDSTHNVTYYRGYYTFPEIREQRVMDGLIDKSSFDEFMEVAGNSFSKYNNKLSLRASINATLWLNGSTLEKGFLSLFAGLETLILQFRRDENVEFIVGVEEWEHLRCTVEGAIKTSTNPILNSQQRKSIYSKLNEINRVSLRDAFELFSKRFSIPHQDLWPLFGENQQAGLSEIRNCLIHGAPFPNYLMECVVVAKIHLEILLERSLLRILNWDVSESNVNQNCLYLYASEVREHSVHGKKIKIFLDESR